ncbi:hypothetical protein NEOLEDRAFT_265963 [Neolentinus lepideus HHB14362 ss-1]|uniref:Uncharacterized protein n=1 Tax=Neolentinus lepideus HHB14362 ss-1 TaxID=1314782 RepID=A0A165T2T5_9AGAM|nr:hypothetical protein NEOLEDRAFT_265963 [Neolentinus lepideus HHB14362 ss-1]
MLRPKYRDTRMCCRRLHGLGRCGALKRGGPTLRKLWQPRTPPPFYICHSSRTLSRHSQQRRDIHQMLRRLSRKATEKVREVARVRQDPKKRRKRSAALAAASVALAGLHEASKDLNIPGLQAVIGTAKEIADRAQKAKGNKDDCLAIVENIRALVETLLDATKDRTLVDVDERLVHDIRCFGSVLESINVAMTEVASQRLWKRITTTSDDKKTIKDCVEKLDAAHNAFNVSMHTGTRIGVLAIIHGQQAMTPTITRVEDQLEQTIEALRAELAQKPDDSTASDMAVQKGRAVELKSSDALCFFFFNSNLSVHHTGLWDLSSVHYTGLWDLSWRSPTYPGYPRTVSLIGCSYIVTVSCFH